MVNSPSLKLNAIGVKYQLELGPSGAATVKDTIEPALRRTGRVAEKGIERIARIAVLHRAPGSRTTDDRCIAIDA